MLDATEKRIDDKITAMKSLQADLSKTVAAYNQQQDREIESLVKIYANMKPSDAATVFNQLDMPILLKIIAAMPERKVAPILAGMDPQTHPRRDAGARRNAQKLQCHSRCRRHTGRARRSGGEAVSYGYFIKSS